MLIWGGFMRLLGKICPMFSRFLLVPIHPAGWPFIAIFAVVAAGMAYIAQPLGWIGGVLTLWCAYFFRNPDRVTPTNQGLAISPADGFVQMIAMLPPPPELNMGSEPMLRISVFMSVFDVHVNRIPVDGKITKCAYIPGKFLNASLDKASEYNERMAVSMTTHDGRPLAFVQIAGLIARRIKCDLVEGQEVKAGFRFGLIRFGSRVDVYLPEGSTPLVALNQLTYAGETVLADLNGLEPARQGEVR